MEKSNSLLANIALSINKRLAGRGGCGQVYYAIYSGREAVAKVATQTKHEDIILREYRMMKELASEYTVAAIVFLHGASITLPEEEDKVPIPRSCLFMEWMNWGTLGQYIVKESKLDAMESEFIKKRNVILQQRAPIMLMACKGIEYIHRKGYVHLDIKAENVLLDYHNNKLQAKIADFGSVLKEGSVTGVFQTPGYVPPESKKSNSKTNKYDIYAFGCMLIHIVMLENFPFMWNGTPKTYEGKEDFLKEHLNDRSLLQLILKCIAPEPYNRPSILTVVDLVSKLNENSFKLANPGEAPLQKKNITAAFSTMSIANEISEMTQDTGAGYLFKELGISKSKCSWNQFWEKYSARFLKDSKYINQERFRIEFGINRNYVSIDNINNTLFKALPIKQEIGDEQVWISQILDILNQTHAKCKQKNVYVSKMEHGTFNLAPELKNNLNSNMVFKFGSPQKPKAAIEKVLHSEQKVANLIILGANQTGKSSLIGSLMNGDDAKAVTKNLVTGQAVKSTMEQAWVSGEDRIATWEFKTEKYSVAINDTPGHNGFLRNLVTGASIADFALILISPNLDQFELEDHPGSETRKQLLLAKHLGINRLIIVVNKMDDSNYSETVFTDIQMKFKNILSIIGYFPQSCPFVPVSGLSGENVLQPSSKMPWYKGWKADTFYEPSHGISLTDAVNSVEIVSDDNKPLRLPVQKVVSDAAGTTIFGRIMYGTLTTGMKIKINPGSIITEVESIHSNDGAPYTTVNKYHQGFIRVRLPLINVSITTKMVISNPKRGPAVDISSFIAILTILPIPGKLVSKTALQMLTSTMNNYCQITRLIQKLDPHTGKVLQERPRYLVHDDVAVVELVNLQTVCLDTFTEFPELGRFTLQQDGRAVAIGVITSIRRA
ncbi:translation elongation factor EF-1 alpha [Boothiomyces sp. JEL0838]|nr:translation elongation factor EF-1 alpha [Boothiomyces sp. JEL0838]